jgi:hypothetical protein
LSRKPNEKIRYREPLYNLSLLPGSAFIILGFLFAMGLLLSEVHAAGYLSQKEEDAVYLFTPEGRLF